MDHGFEKLGFDVLEAFDFDAKAVATYNLNNKPVAKHRELTSGSILGNSADVIIASPPCQGFSTAGGYRGEKDPRNELFLTAIDLIIAAKPKVAVIENVAALTNVKNRQLLDRALLTLRAAGYAADYTILQVEKFGVPQRRRRIFIVARKENRLFNLDAFGSGQANVSLRASLEGLDECMSGHLPRHLPEGSKHKAIALRIRQGQKLCNVRVSSNAVATWEIPEVFGPTTEPQKTVLRYIQRARRSERVRNYGDADPVSLETLQKGLGCEVEGQVEELLGLGYLRRVGDCIDLTNTFNGKFRRLSLDGLSPTVDTRFGDFRLFLHPTEHRGMTVREAARIQGFPDSFQFPAEERAAFRQVGNAVPPPVAASVASFVKELL
ncbi:hypothetical protein A9Z06_13545 [Rhizobium sp. YK2]|nr:hypothetical protein A9Z06_13545 [Rhizobium sp. YK2]